MAASDEGYQHIEHGFEPVFDQHSRVLVLGSFPSVLSRANAFLLRQPSESLLACDGHVPRYACAAQRGRSFGKR